MKYWKTQGCLWGAMTTVTGPNDARRVVWALGEFFFFLRVFYLFNDLHRYYGCSEGTEGSSGEATTTTTGPNDARRVVWA